MRGRGFRAMCGLAEIEGVWVDRCKVKQKG